MTGYRWPAYAWPDIELILTEYLREALAGVRVLTDTPADLAEAMPVVRVRRDGGTNDGITTSAVIDIDVYAASRTEASEIGARLSRALLYHVPGTDRVEAATELRGVHHPDPAVCQRGATYAVDVRARLTERG